MRVASRMAPGRCGRQRTACRRPPTGTTPETGHCLADLVFPDGDRGGSPRHRMGADRPSGAGSAAARRTATSTPAAGGSRRRASWPTWRCRDPVGHATGPEDHSVGLTPKPASYCGPSRSPRSARTASIGTRRMGVSSAPRRTTTISTGSTRPMARYAKCGSWIALPVRAAWSARRCTVTRRRPGSTYTA